jgi:hypothetical protein
MAKPVPKKWCASFYTNSITMKKMTADNLRFPRGSYHDTWDEAHAAMVERRKETLKKAEREFQRCRMALVKARAMKPPQAPEGDTPLRNGQTMQDIAEAEREHMGDPEKETGIYASP